MPDNGAIFYHLGALYAQLQDHRKAIEELEKSVALAGPSRERLEMLALQYLFAGNRQEAREYAYRLRDTYPSHRREIAHHENVFPPMETIMPKATENS